MIGGLSLVGNQRRWSIRLGQSGKNINFNGRDSAKSKGRSEELKAFGGRASQFVSFQISDKI